MLIFTDCFFKNLFVNSLNAWNGRRGLVICFELILCFQHRTHQHTWAAASKGGFHGNHRNQSGFTKVRWAMQHLYPWKWNWLHSPVWLYFLLNFHIIAGDTLIITCCYASRNSIQPVEGQPFLPCWSTENSEWRRHTPIWFWLNFCFILCTLSKYWRQRHVLA